MRLLLVIGCPLKYTPVIVAYTDYLAEMGCEFDLVEYNHKERFVFARNVFRRLCGANYDRIVLVNVQSLIFGLLAWLPRFPPVVYWKLESGRAFENFSLAGCLPVLEWAMPRARMSLIVPSYHRRDVQSPIFRSANVIPNAPLRPYFARENIRNERRINDFPPNTLVMYGNLGRDPVGMYISEWERFVAGSNRLRMDFLGMDGPCEELFHNVRRLSKIPHSQLIDLLLSFSYMYSVIGYRPVGVNTKLAAPNRLIESLSCGVPVIVHSENPYLVQTVESYGCGFVMNFESLDFRSLEHGLRDWERHARGARKAAIELSLTTALRGTALECKVHG